MTKNNLPDIQNQKDTRGKKIQKVGIREYLAPIMVYNDNHTPISVVGNFSVYCSLDSSIRGANMSRFVQVIDHAVGNCVSLEILDDVLQHMKKILGSNDAYIKVKFDYFCRKASPVTQQKGFFHVPTILEGRLVDGKIEKFLTVEIDYTSCCPCSKEISKYGAHNQRSTATITIELIEFFSIEELVSIIEKEVSCEIYPLLKREDEKYVTETAYNNPKFVEDTARDISLKLDKLLDDKIIDYVIVLNHFESIHQHNAVCVLSAGRNFK